MKTGEVDGSSRFRRSGEESLKMQDECRNHGDGVGRAYSRGGVEARSRAGLRAEVGCACVGRVCTVGTNIRVGAREGCSRILGGRPVTGHGALA